MLSDVIGYNHAYAGMLREEELSNGFLIAPDQGHQPTEETLSAVLLLFSHAQLAQQGRGPLWQRAIVSRMDEALHGCDQVLGLAMNAEALPQVLMLHRSHERHVAPHVVLW